MSRARTLKMCGWIRSLDKTCQLRLVVCLQLVNFRLLDQLCLRFRLRMCVCLAFGELVSFPGLLHLGLHGSQLLRTLEVRVFLELVQKLCQVDLWKGGRLLRWTCPSLSISPWGLGRCLKSARRTVGLWSPASVTTLAREPQTLEATVAASPAVRNARPTIFRNIVCTLYYRKQQYCWWPRQRQTVKGVNVNGNSSQRVGL